jgi:hypothetical protein
MSQKVLSLLVTLDLLQRYCWCKEEVKDGPGNTPTAAIYEPAKEAAKKMEKEDP